MVMQIPSFREKCGEMTPAECQTEPIECKDRPVQTPFNSDAHERDGAKLKEAYPKFVTPGEYIVSGKKTVSEAAGGRWPISKEYGINCDLGESSSDDIRQAAAAAIDLNSNSPAKEVQKELTEVTCSPVSHFPGHLLSAFLRRVF